MGKKIILITGASSGIGHDLAEKILEDETFKVYIASRNVGKMMDLKNQGAEIIRMDVTLDGDVTSGIDTIINNEGRLDILVSNAGYGTYGTIENVSIEEIKYQYDVNVFGMARLIKTALPHMRKQKSGKIIITSSVVSNMTTLGMGYYSSTKYALKAIAIALRQEVVNLGIDVSLIEPGAVKSGFDNIALKKLKEIDYPQDYKKLMDGFNRYMTNTYEKCIGTKSTVKCMLKAIYAKKPRAIYRTTPDAKWMPTLAGMMPAKLYDKYVISMMKRAK